MNSNNKNNVNFNNPLTATNAGKKPSLAVYDFSNEENLFSKKNKSHTPINRAAAAGDSNSNNINNYNKNNEIQTNQTYSNKNKTSGFNFKKFNYVFGDGNSTTNKTKTSFFKSQTDHNTTNTINNTNEKHNEFTNNFNNNAEKISQKSIVSNQYTIASKEMSNLIKKVQFDGDITNMKGRIKKN